MDIRPPSLASPLPLPPSASLRSSVRAATMDKVWSSMADQQPAPCCPNQLYPPLPGLALLLYAISSVARSPADCCRLLPWAGRCCCIRLGLAWRGPQLAAAGRGQAPAQPRLAAVERCPAGQRCRQSAVLGQPSPTSSAALCSGRRRRTSRSNWKKVRGLSEESVTQTNSAVKDLLAGNLLNFRNS